MLHDHMHKTAILTLVKGQLVYAAWMSLKMNPFRCTLEHIASQKLQKDAAERWAAQQARPGSVAAGQSQKP